MQKVMESTSSVEKRGRNDFHKYDYATEADVISAIRPHMVKNGLILVPHVDTVHNDPNGNTNIVVCYRLYHTSGEFLEFNIPASGNDRNSKGGVGDKGIYKALTGASKYAMLKVFCMATGDDPEVASEADKSAAKVVVQVPKVMHQLPSDDLDCDNLPPIPNVSAKEGNPEIILKTIEPCAAMAQTTKELNAWYTDNKTVMDKLKEIDKTSYETALKYLKNRKEVLNG